MRLRDERPVLYVLIVVLIGLNTFLLSNMKRRDIVHSVPTAIPGRDSYIPSFALCDSNGKEWSSQELLKRSEYTLFVFFSLSDCLPCRREGAEWPAINEREQIKVAAIADHVSERELTDWARNSGILFPVLFDKELKVREAFGISETPARVFANQDGKVLLESTYEYPFNRFVNDMDRIVSRRE